MRFWTLWESFCLLFTMKLINKLLSNILKMILSWNFTAAQSIFIWLSRNTKEKMQSKYCKLFFSCINATKLTTANQWISFTTVSASSKELQRSLTSSLIILIKPQMLTILPISSNKTIISFLRRYLKCLRSLSRNMKRHLLNFSPRERTLEGSLSIISLRILWPTKKKYSSKRPYHVKSNFLWTLNPELKCKQRQQQPWRNPNRRLCHMISSVVLCISTSLILTWRAQVISS